MKSEAHSYFFCTSGQSWNICLLFGLACLYIKIVYTIWEIVYTISLLFTEWQLYCLFSIRLMFCDPVIYYNDCIIYLSILYTTYLTYMYRWRLNLYESCLPIFEVISSYNSKITERSNIWGVLSNVIEMSNYK